MNELEKILLLGLIVVVMYFLLCTKTKWYSPAGIYTLESVFFVFSAVYLFAVDIKYSMLGIIWWLVSCAVMIFGQKINIRVQGSTNDTNAYTKVKSNGGLKDREYPLNIVWKVLGGVVFVGICVALSSLWKKGFSVKDIFNLSTLARINNAAAYNRYYSQESTTFLGQVLIVFYYIAPLCGGYMLPLATGNRQRILSLCSIVPGFLSMVINNGKSTFLAAVMLWISALIVSMLDNGVRFPKLKFKFCIKIVIIFLLVIAFLYVSMCLRVGDLSEGTREIINKKILVYAFGQVEAFSLWFDTVEFGRYEFGVNTFMVIPRLFGLVDRKQGVYGFMGNSNVFTANRGVIQDYGIFGGLLFYLVLGIMSTYLIKTITRKKKCSLSIMLLTSNIFFVLYGSIISPWIYTSYVLAFVAFGLFVKFTKIYR